MLSDFTVDRIKRFFESKKESYIVYHDWNHAVSVAKRAIEIAKASTKDLTELDLDILEFASYFHDIGWSYFKSDAENVSYAIELCEEYAKSHPRDVKVFMDEGVWDYILDIIRATQFPHNDTWDTLCKIIQDADLTECWGGSSFESYEKLVKEEEFALKSKHRSLVSSRYKPSLLFPSISMLNTKYAREKQREYGEAYKNSFAKEIEDWATYRVYKSFKEGFSSDKNLRALESLKLVRELFPVEG